MFCAVQKNAVQTVVYMPHCASGWAQTCQGQGTTGQAPTMSHNQAINALTLNDLTSMGRGANSAAVHTAFREELQRDAQVSEWASEWVSEWRVSEWVREWLSECWIGRLQGIRHMKRRCWNSDVSIHVTNSLWYGNYDDNYQYDYGYDADADHDHDHYCHKTGYAMPPHCTVPDCTVMIMIIT